ncbi:MAG: TatD family hydrolase [Bacteroidota bacterium]
MMPQYIDSHAHLFFEEYRTDLQVVLDRAKESGICAVIVPGTDLKTSREAVVLAEKFPEISACVGIHPHDASGTSDKDLEEIEELSRHPKVVAIGEIGLDYHYDYSPRGKQTELLIAQLELAVRRNLPCVLHTRESMADVSGIVAKIIQKYPVWRAGGLPRRGVFHCFPGTAEEALRVREMGFWVSFTGNVTFKKSTSIDVVRELGMDRFFLETDSPYMTPVPLRGSRNEPAYIARIGKMLAQTLNVEESELARTTTSNAMALFALNISGSVWEKSFERFS